MQLALRSLRTLGGRGSQSRAWRGAACFQWQRNPAPAASHRLSWVQHSDLSSRSRPRAAGKAATSTDRFELALPACLPRSTGSSYARTARASFSALPLLRLVLPRPTGRRRRPPPRPLPCSKPAHQPRPVPWALPAWHGQRRAATAPPEWQLGTHTTSACSAHPRCVGI